MRDALIVYFAASYPNANATLRFMRACRGDIIEIGIPFSDPVADGPVIQRAYAYALERGFRVRDAFEIVKKFKEDDDRSVVIMTYYNPVYTMGMREFLEAAAESGADGMLIVDLPSDSEEIPEYADICRDLNLSPVMLAAPNTSAERLSRMNEVADVIYLVSTYGVTGARKEIAKIAFDSLRRVKDAVDKPVIIGFGVSKKEHVESLMSAGADGVVVGSAVVDMINRNLNDVEKAEKLIKEFTESLKVKNRD